MAHEPEDVHLPPLEWLRVFEAAARNGTFTGAARELNLTQAAVSQRLRNLEARLGARLFDRLARGVRLTVEGEAYAPHVRAALEALERSTGDLFGTPRRNLAIAASPSVIDLWIVPRLPALRAAAPRARLSFVTVHRLGELEAAEADLDIRFGDGTWPGRQARKLFDEVLAPVAAPPLLKTAADWRLLPAIALSGPRGGWREWASATGVAPPATPVLRFETFAQARSAAMVGAGVLLGSLSLISEDIARGLLARPDEPEFRMADAYWVTWDNTRAASVAGLVEALCAGPPD